MIGGSSVLYLARAPCVPLFSTLFIRGGNRRVFRLPGEGGDHFHCTVEPSPGHSWCRELSSLSQGEMRCEEHVTNVYVACVFIVLSLL